MKKLESEEIFDDSEETEIEWQRTELQTSRLSPYLTIWKKEGTDLQPFTENLTLNYI